MKNRCAFCDPTEQVDPRQRILRIGCVCTCGFHRHMAEEFVSNRQDFVDRRIRRDPIRDRADQLARDILAAVGLSTENDLFFQNAFDFTIGFAESYRRHPNLTKQGLRAVLAKMGEDVSRLPKLVPESLRIKAERFSRIEAALCDRRVKRFLKLDLQIGSLLGPTEKTDEALKPLIEAIRETALAFVTIWDRRRFAHNSRPSHRDRREYHAGTDERLWNPGVVNNRMRYKGRLQISGRHTLPPDDPTRSVQVSKCLLERCYDGSTPAQSATSASLVTPSRRQRECRCFEDRLSDGSVPPARFRSIAATGFRSRSMSDK